MRSIIEFLVIVLITVLVPGLITPLISTMGGGDLTYLLGQLLIIAIFIFIFTNLMKYTRKYEADTRKLVDVTRDLDTLRQIRNDRRTFKSKAYATSKILAVAYSEDEVENLKKYASSKEDMDHYYAARIDHASSKEERKDLQSKRDSFYQRYGRKLRIYPDFRENMKTAGKWTGFFLIVALIYNIVPRFITKDVTLASFYLIGMLILAIIMINTIIWIVRTLKSNWMKEYF